MFRTSVGRASDMFGKCVGHLWGMLETCWAYCLHDILQKYLFQEYTLDVSKGPNTTEGWYLTVWILCCVGSRRVEPPSPRWAFMFITCWSVNRLKSMLEIGGCQRLFVRSILGIGGCTDREDCSWSTAPFHSMLICFSWFMFLVLLKGDIRKLSTTLSMVPCKRASNLKSILRLLGSSAHIQPCFKPFLYTVAKLLVETWY